MVVGKGWNTKGWGNVSLLQFSEWIIFTLERSWLNFIFIPVQNLENRTLHSKVIRKNDLQKLAENLPNTPFAWFEADNYNKGILSIKHENLFHGPSTWSKPFYQSTIYDCNRKIVEKLEYFSSHHVQNWQKSTLNCIFWSRNRWTSLTNHAN